MISGMPSPWTSRIGEPSHTGRGVAKSLLEGVESGYLITDGYPAYDALCLQHSGIVHAACWAHARRKFHEALQCGRTMASHPLDDISRIYQAQHRIDALVDALGKRWKRLGRGPWTGAPSG